jgi:hypothetical protein
MKKESWLRNDEMAMNIRAKDGEKGSGIAVRMLLIIIIALLLSEMVFAANIMDGIRGAGGRIGGFFSNYASSEGPTFLDFLIFTVIFFALCWVGFSSVFKDAKNANVVLSVAVGLALSVALVYGGKFTLKKLFPFAAVILFILLFVMIYALLKKFIFTKDTIMSKILSAVFAIIISVALLIVAFNFICGGDRCESNAFLRKVFGSESILGKLFRGIGNIFEGGPLPPPPSPAQVAGATANCRNTVIDPGEACTIGPNGDQNIGCGAGTVCDNCARCVPQSPAGSAAGMASLVFSSWQTWVLIALILLGSISIIKRKKIKEKVKGWREGWRKRKEIGALTRLLGKLRSDEKELSHDIKQLIENVKQEKGPFEASRHIIDMITKDIKDTIGGNIELIRSGEKAGLFSNINEMHSLNDKERSLVVAKILPTIMNEVDTISRELSEEEEVFRRLNELENVGQHFDQHSDILDQFRHYDFKEKDVVNNMLAKLRENIDGFTRFKDCCDRMIESLDDAHGRIVNIEEGKRIEYHQVVESIKAIRYGAIKLNSMFITKINVLHYIVMKMEELKREMHNLHAAEIEGLEGRFMAKALEAEARGEFDTAAYLAWHVVENAEFLLKVEIDAESTEKLKNMEKGATELIKRCMPKVIESVRPKIEEELVRGKYDEVKATLEHLEMVRIKKDKAARAVEDEVRRYRDAISVMKELCEKLIIARGARKELYDELNG